ncbi:MAG TPA: hypothetical protein VKW08_19305 [Xanthobacteraceae bacterium]|nr:hypothetical protein [Xanthobacteraceae bacterium]
MRAKALTLMLMLMAALCVGACVPDVVSLEAVPTSKFARDLAQCQAAIGDDSLAIGNPTKQCMKAKGYRFLRPY